MWATGQSIFFRNKKIESGKYGVGEGFLQNGKQLRFPPTPLLPDTLTINSRHTHLRTTMGWPCPRRHVWWTRRRLLASPQLINSRKWGMNQIATEYPPSNLRYFPLLRSAHWLMGTIFWAHEPYAEKEGFSVPWFLVNLGTTRERVTLKCFTSSDVFNQHVLSGLHRALFLCQWSKYGSSGTMVKKYWVLQTSPLAIISEGHWSQH